MFEKDKASRIFLNRLDSYMENSFRLLPKYAKMIESLKDKKQEIKLF
jgi:hypothetical protein